MIHLYSLIIHIANTLVHFIAFFNPKAKAFVNGRIGLFSQLSAAFAKENNPILWIHCASLGEFEQGRPLIEQFKKEFSTHKILLTFFSPSGYNVRKNYDQADYIFYLPWDTPRNARRFIEVTQPKMLILVKYEFWFNYIKVLNQHNVPILSISSIFRKNQIFFKPYGSFFRSMLKRINYFFVQNSNSEKLLKTIGLSNATITGDTRFDRVKEIARQVKEILIAKQFKGTDNVMVVGSCWPEDLEILLPLINAKPMKFIIAPHEIKESFLKEIERNISVKTIRYSGAHEQIADCDVLIIDNIGMLSSLYQYAEYAFVGGGFGKGLHNILEAACFGIPVFFGNENYKKFKEAEELIMRGGAFAVNDFHDLKQQLELLINRPENYLLACEVTKSYIEENLGATEAIMKYCRQIIPNP